MELLIALVMGMLLDRFGWKYLAVVKHAFDRPVTVSVSRVALPKEVLALLPRIIPLFASADKMDAGGMYKRQWIIKQVPDLDEGLVLYAIQALAYGRKNEQWLREALATGQQTTGMTTSGIMSTGPKLQR